MFTHNHSNLIYIYYNKNNATFLESLVSYIFQPHHILLKCLLKNIVKMLQAKVFVLIIGRQNDNLSLK